jgi:hypothetical protein
MTEIKTSYDVQNVADFTLYKAYWAYIIGKLSYKNTLLSFERILPTPTELKNIVVGSIPHPQDPSKRLTEWKEDGYGNPQVIPHEEFSKRVYTYGASNWRDWRLKYWGCQFNPTEIGVFQMDEETVRFRFRTDSLPKPIIQKLTDPEFQKILLGHEAIKRVNWLTVTEEGIRSFG